MKSYDSNQIQLESNDIMKPRKHTHCLFFAGWVNLQNLRWPMYHPTRMLKDHLISQSQTIEISLFVQNDLLPIYLIQWFSSLLFLPFGSLGSIPRPEYFVPALPASELWYSIESVFQVLISPALSLGGISILVLLYLYLPGLFLPDNLPKEKHLMFLAS